MTKSKGFNLADILHPMSSLDTKGESGQLHFIACADIYTNERNFYDVSQVDALVDAILLDGLQSPLLLHARAEGGYVIISGHRRFAALRRIMDEGLSIAAGRLFCEEIGRGLIPALLANYESEAQAELALLLANSNARVLTSAELSKQAERIEATLYALKEQGYDFPGRMRAHVAAACQVSEAKLARLRKIRTSLAPDFEDLYADGKLGETVAYALAQLPEETQTRIFTAKQETGTLSSLAEWSVQKLADALPKIYALACDFAEGAPCENRAGRFACLCHSAYGSCAETCCAQCHSLRFCKYACAKLTDDVTAQNEQRQRVQAEHEAKQAQRQAERTARICAIWKRFAAARNAAGLTLGGAAALLWEDPCTENEVRELAALERGEGIDHNTDLPCDICLEDVDAMLKLAKGLACSVGFLFGEEKDV